MADVGAIAISAARFNVPPIPISKGYGPCSFNRADSLKTLDNIKHHLQCFAGNPELCGRILKQVAEVSTFSEVQKAEYVLRVTAPLLSHVAETFREDAFKDPSVVSGVSALLDVAMQYPEKTTADVPAYTKALVSITRGAGMWPIFTSVYVYSSMIFT